MAMNSKWDLLALPSTFTGIPPLLVKFHSNSTGYTILLTDLTYVWSETLDRRDVIRRAFQEDTSIDPSEDSHQFQILLDKVRQALCGHDGSILELSQLEAQRLVLRVSSPLPAPLRQLQWPLYLSPATSTLLTTEFTVPLLERYAQQVRRVESLLAYIKEKDHVISKLVDKLDSSGVEVSTVFLNAASLKTGKKALTWDLAGKAVRGLSAFSEREWIHSLESSQQLEMNVGEILRAVFTTTPLESGPRKQFGKTAEATREWWKDLHQKLTLDVDGTSSTTASGKEAARRPAKPTGESDIDRDVTEDSDEEFQKQATPPALQNQKGEDARSGHVPKATHHKNSELDAETTDDGSRSLTPPYLEPPSKLRPTERKLGRGSSPGANDNDLATDSSKIRSPKKLGTIGGNKKLTPTGRGTEPDREMQIRAQTRVGDIGSEAERQPNEEQSLRSVERQPPQSMSTGPPRASHRLGKIGGSKKPKDSEILDQPMSTSSMRQKEQPRNLVDRVPDRFEGEGTLRPDHLHALEEPHRPSVRQSDEQLPEAPPENSREAADQRRAELKRQLESKSAAPSKKKKRKF